MPKSYRYTPGIGVSVSIRVGIHIQNVRANVKVYEFQSFCISSCILAMFILLIKSLTTKAHPQACTLWLWHHWHCKCGYFRWGETLRICWQALSHGCNFQDTSPICWIKSYGFYFHVGEIFCEEGNILKNAKITVNRENFAPILFSPSDLRVNLKLG